MLRVGQPPRHRRDIRTLRPILAREEKLGFLNRAKDGFIIVHSDIGMLWSLLVAKEVEVPGERPYTV